MILKNEFRAKIIISNSMTSSLNLDTLFGEIQCTLEKNINMMLNEERLKHSEYKELHNHIMSLPVVAKLVAENKLLQDKLAEYEGKKYVLKLWKKIFLLIQRKLFTPIVVNP